HAVGIDEPDAARPTARDELVAQPALAHAGLADDPDAHRLPRERPLQGLVEHRHLRAPPDEARKAAGARGVEPRAQPADADELVQPDGLRGTLDPRRPEVPQVEV